MGWLSSLGCRLRIVWKWGGKGSLSYTTILTNYSCWEEQELFGVGAGVAAKLSVELLSLLITHVSDQGHE